MQAVQLRRVIMQDHVRQLDGAIPRDFPIIQHFRQRQSKRLPARAARHPARLFPAQFVRIGISIGRKQDFFRGEFQPIPKHMRHGARIIHQCLRGEIGVHVGFRQQRRDLASKRPAAVQQDEIGSAQARIVEYRFEQ